jgi:hypothetical protein
MKHLLVALLLASFSFSSALADSPEAILKDYRKQATQAVERLNQSLEKAATPLITKLVKDGDTTGAERLTKELHAKLAGDTVPAPQASAVQLFSLYDEAYAKALAPVQKSCIARIESLLKTAGGPKLEMVTELGKVREEIEAGKVSNSKFPLKWDYYADLKDKPIALMELKANGVCLLTVLSSGKVEEGQWKQGKEKNIISLTANGSTWDMEMNLQDNTATMWRPDSGRRYLKGKGL